MEKKIYVIPEADFMMFAPSETIAASWDWNIGNFGKNASVIGNVQIFQDTEDSWKYSGSDKPY